MKLADLDPRWLSPEVLSFLCPKCLNGRDRVTVKRVPMGIREQLDLFAATLGDDAVYCHPCKVENCWTITGADFASLTASPSLDIKGHWHGWVTNGEVTDA